MSHASNWMIRKPDLTFTRPISEAELIRKIESGEILPNDEICRSTDYWFTIQEVEEVKKHFGNILLQSLVPTGSDVTKATNPIPIAEMRKKAETAKISLQTAPKAEPRVERQPVPVAEPTDRRALLFGVLLAAIFCATLGILWMGSH